MAHRARRQVHDKRTPVSSQMKCSLEFSPLLVRPTARGTSPFLKARRRAARLQMRAVYHDPIRRRTFARERHEDAVENPKTAQPMNRLYSVL